MSEEDLLKLFFAEGALGARRFIEHILQEHAPNKSSGPGKMQSEVRPLPRIHTDTHTAARPMH
jgi:hypothetical protein